MLCLQQSDMHCHAIIMNISVAIARRSHPFPSRTRKLSSFAPMVLHGRLCGRVGAAGFKTWRPFDFSKGLFFCVCGLVKSPYAALHFIFRYCGLRKVRLIPQDLCALPLEHFTKPHKFVDSRRRPGSSASSTYCNIRLRNLLVAAAFYFGYQSCKTGIIHRTFCSLPPEPFTMPPKPMYNQVL